MEETFRSGEDSVAGDYRGTVESFSLRSVRLRGMPLRVVPGPQPAPGRAQTGNARTRYPQPCGARGELVMGGLPCLGWQIRSFYHAIGI